MRAQAGRTSWDVSGRLWTSRKTSQDVLETSRLAVHRLVYGCVFPFPDDPGYRARGPRSGAAYPWRTRWFCRRSDPKRRLLEGRGGRDVLGSARECVQCDAADGVVAGVEEMNDVGARQRPSLGANQRGRASMSSSAGNVGPSERLGSCVQRLRRCFTSTTGRATERWEGGPSSVGPIRWCAAHDRRLGWPQR